MITPMKIEHFKQFKTAAWSVTHSCMCTSPPPGDLQALYGVDVEAMLEDEVAWLGNFQPSEHPELRDTDNRLLAGHLNLIRTLFTCQNIHKEEYGRSSAVVLPFQVWKNPDDL